MTERTEPTQYVVEAKISDPSNPALCTTAIRFGIASALPVSSILEQDQKELKLVSGSTLMTGGTTRPMYTVDIAIDGEIYRLEVIVASERFLGLNFLRMVRVVLRRDSVTIQKID